ncbi:hypothetical protein J3E69DRAFT_330469 [Trichoderma sp. SZMC 28015]
MEEQVTEREWKRLFGYLEQASNELDQTVNTSATLKEIKNLPPTFYLVVKHLSVVKEAVTSIRTCLRDGGAYPTSHEKYKALCDFSKSCRNQSKYLRDLIDAVTTANSPTTPDTQSPANLDKYYKVVEGGKGFKVDDVLKGLFQEAVDVTSATPLIDDNLRETLQNALQEISLQRASSSELPKAGVMLSNYGSGSQFCHNGTGNQNRCDGGIQITGNGPTSFGQNFRP